MTARKIILLVEDNPDDEELTLMAFRENRINNDVVVVRDGQEALDYLFKKGAYADRNQYEVPLMVLLDIKLPKIDGLEVLQQLRNNPSTRLLPVVILTSSKEEQDLIKGYTHGVNSYIRKPVDFIQFNEAVKSLGVYWTLFNESPPVIDP